jgi:hypothetical protein
MTSPLLQSQANFLSCTGFCSLFIASVFVACFLKYIHRHRPKVLPSRLRIRDNVDFEASLLGEDGQVCMKLSKNGKLYVTTIRMVFVASNPDVNSDFCSFDIPLSNVRGEKFNQPIFGCNNLSGSCLPLPGFNGSISWVLAFKSGGVGRLLSVLQDLLVRNRTGRPEAPEGELIMPGIFHFLALTLVTAGIDREFGAELFSADAAKISAFHDPAHSPLKRFFSRNARHERWPYRSWVR